MITFFYASLLGFLYFILSIDTIKARRKYQISLGSGPNQEIAAIVSAHSNFASYVPILLILTYSLESLNAFPETVIHGVAATYTLGRFFHYLAFRSQKMIFKWRILGMHMTLWPLLVLSLSNLVAIITKTLKPYF